MSTVKADNFTWRTGEATANSQYTVTADKVVWGTAKTWIQYNGSSPAIRGSFNVTSVTKNNTGDYTINYSNSLTDANYSIAGCSDFTTAFVVSMNSTSAAPATGNIRINNRTSAAGAADSAYVFLTVNR